MGRAGTASDRTAQQRFILGYCADLGYHLVCDSGPVGRSTSARLGRLAIPIGVCTHVWDLLVAGRLSSHDTHATWVLRVTRYFLIWPQLLPLLYSQPDMDHGSDLGRFFNHGLLEHARCLLDSQTPP